MVKIQQLPNGQLVLTIPKKLAEFKGWSKGLKIVFKDHKDGVLLEIKEEE